MLEKQCKKCQVQFKITDEDLKFYDKISPVFAGKKYQIPSPTLCPECRLQKKLSQINQTNLFSRKCDATNENIISNYPPISSYKVFSQKYWFSDKFDASEYGRDFDFSKPFFQQFQELGLQVPRPALMTDFLNDENSAYTNYSGKNKNCYLIFDSDQNQDCYFSYGMNSSKNSMDCYRVQNLELGYQNIDCKNCYQCTYLQNCENCTDSFFLENCAGCKNCLFCVNLQRKEYYIRNKPVSKEEFEEAKKSLSSHSYIEKLKQEFQEYKKTFPKKYMVGIQNENVSGNYLVHCKNALECYDSMNVQDGKYCTQMFMYAKDCMDCNECGEGELFYECCNLGYNAYHILFSSEGIHQLTRILYCNICFHSSDLFGCIGLKHKKYCILNKQYSKEEYESLVPKIIDKMIQDKEWGEFFPETFSAFPYKYTLAFDFFPLSKDETLKQGFHWSDYETPKPNVEKIIPAGMIPDDIKNIPDDILNWAIECEVTKKPFRIIKQELQFYRDHNLPIPRKHPDQRHKERMLLRNPRKLWDRNCMKCSKEIQTTYAPDRPEIVYCEDCYLKEVY